MGLKRLQVSLEQLANILSRKPEGFLVFSGDDALAFPAVCLGADGVISVVANLIPREFHTLMEIAANGDFRNAKSIYYQYLKLIQLCFVESNPIPVKTGLSLMGLIKEEFRSPMSKIQEDNKLKLKVEMEKVSLL